MYHCVAKLFALQELRLVIATLVLRYDMRPGPGFDILGYADKIKAAEHYFFDGSLDVIFTQREKQTVSERKDSCIVLA